VLRTRLDRVDTHRHLYDALLLSYRGNCRRWLVRPAPLLAHCR
jgi:hypothetical protein